MPALPSDWGRQYEHTMNTCHPSSQAAVRPALPAMPAPEHALLRAQPRQAGSGAGFPLAYLHGTSGLSSGLLPQTTISYQHPIRRERAAADLRRDAARILEIMMTARPAAPNAAPSLIDQVAADVVKIERQNPIRREPAPVAAAPAPQNPVQRENAPGLPRIGHPTQGAADVVKIEHQDPIRRESAPGPLRNGNPRGNPNAAPRCGAKTRLGCPCKGPAMANGKCRMHGGASTGPKTAEGRARIAATQRARGYPEIRAALQRAAAVHRRGTVVIAMAKHGLSPADLAAPIRAMRGLPPPDGHGDETMFALRALMEMELTVAERRTLVDLIRGSDICGAQKPMQRGEAGPGAISDRKRAKPARDNVGEWRRPGTPPLTSERVSPFYAACRVGV